MDGTLTIGKSGMTGEIRCLPFAYKNKKRHYQGFFYYQVNDNSAGKGKTAWIRHVVWTDGKPNNWEDVEAGLMAMEPELAEPEKPDLAVKVQRIPGNDLPLPVYQTEGSSGVDLHACIPEGEVLKLKPMVPVIVPTGLRFEIPEGYEIQIRPRSGLACKKGVTVVNSPGTADSSYRGDIGVGLVLIAPENAEPFEVRRGDRIAQAVLQKVERIAWKEVDSLSNTQRGEGGFGSTGV